MYLLTTKTFQRFEKLSVPGKKDKPVLLFLSISHGIPLNFKLSPVPFSNDLAVIIEQKKFDDLTSHSCATSEFWIG
jgi:hypothetical protein